MTRPARWWLLSDLHLGITDDDPRRPGKVLPEFLRREVLAACPRLPIGIRTLCGTTCSPMSAAIWAVPAGS